MPQRLDCELDPGPVAPGESRMMTRPASRPIGRTGLRISELGFGAAPLGNLYANISDEVAHAALVTALDAGVTYVDTAPYYGFGLSERRVGDVLRKRSDVVVSTKVGRLLVPAVSLSTDRHGFVSDMPFAPLFDYSYDGVMRSWEHSLHRLGLARIDILYVHDIGRLTHGERHSHTCHDLTAGGGLRALEELRADGQIRAFGVGVNEIEICMELMEASSLDVILLAGRYTLLEQSALDLFLPACEARNISVVVGGPYNSGILATGVQGNAPRRYNYEAAPDAVVEKVRRIEAVCERHGVTLAAAALQFPLAHPQVAAVIPGLDGPLQVSRAFEQYDANIPSDFWSELRTQGLLLQDAPTPAPTA